MAADKETLDLVRAVEAQGKALFVKWDRAARRPQGFGQLREFVAEIDEFATFVDVVEARIQTVKADRMDEVLVYLTQLRVQIFVEKLELMERLLEPLVRGGAPLPLGSQPYFKTLRQWVQMVRRLNHAAVREFGKAPVPASTLQRVDALLKVAIGSTRDLPDLGQGTGRPRGEPSSEGAPRRLTAAQRAVAKLGGMD